MANEKRLIGAGASEKEHLPLLPDGSIRVLVTADLEVIKARFAERMRGSLPAPVAAMLERKHGCFDMEPHDVHVISGHTSVDDVCRKIAAINIKELNTTVITGLT